jgi:hypothetical protein
MTISPTVFADVVLGVCKRIVCGIVNSGKALVNVMLRVMMIAQSTSVLTGTVV